MCSRVEDVGVNITGMIVNIWEELCFCESIVCIED